MKTSYIFIVLCFLPYFFCDLGGVKLLIDQKFINAAHQRFYSYFRNGLNKIDLPDIGPIEEVALLFPNLKKEHIVLSFENDGTLYLKIKDVIPRITGTVYYKIVFIRCHNNLKLELRNFHLEGKLRIKSKMIANQKYVLDAEFVTRPTINFEANLDIDGFGGSIVAKFFQGNINMGLRLALPKLEALSNDILKKHVISNIPQSVLIKTPKANYNLDLTLVSPASIRNKFLELNTYAYLYHNSTAHTKNYNRYQLTNLPSVTKMDNQLQFYISEYSVNSGLYTLLTMNKVIDFKLTTKELSLLFPNVVQQYGNKMANGKIFIMLDPKVNITEEYIHIKTSGSIHIGIPGEAFNFGGHLELNMKVEAKVIPGPKISGKIHQLEGRITHSGSQNEPNLTNNVFQFIEEVIRPVLNVFITNNIPFSLPEILGVRFTDLSIEHKNHYLAVNYNILN